MNTPEPEAPGIQLARSTMRGDIRDAMLRVLKETKGLVRWDKLTEAQQQEIVDAIEKGSYPIVESAVTIIASDARESMRFSVKKVETVKGEIVIKLSTTFAADAWAALGNTSVVEVIEASPGAYMGADKPSNSHVVPDQADLVQAAEAPVMDHSTVGQRIAAERAEAGEPPRRGRGRPKKNADPAPEPELVETPREYLSDEGLAALAGEPAGDDPEEAEAEAEERVPDLVYE